MKTINKEDFLDLVKNKDSVFEGYKFDKMTLIEEDLKYLIFRDCDLTEVEFFRCDLTCAVFCLTDLSKVKFFRSIMKFSNIGRFIVKGTSFTECDLTFVVFGEDIDLTETSFFLNNTSDIRLPPKSFFIGGLNDTIYILNGKVVLHKGKRRTIKEVIKDDSLDRKFVDLIKIVNSL